MGTVITYAGTGTFAAWTLSLSGPQGAQGSAASLSGTATGPVNFITGANIASASTITSDHSRGMAADFVAPGYGTPYDIAKALAPLVSVLGIGQLIHEFGQWVHVSTRVPGSPANRVITISSAGTELGVQEVA